MPSMPRNREAQSIPEVASFPPFMKKMHRSEIRPKKEMSATPLQKLILFSFIPFVERQR